MGYKRFCVICGTEFESDMPYFSSCSERCRGIFSRQQLAAAWEILESSIPKALEILGLGAIEEYPEWKEQQKQGNIYFVRGDDKVKIGFSKDVESRIKDLQASSPLELSLLLTIKGTTKTENELHDRFDKYRIRGEWFRYEGELEEFVAASVQAK